MKKISKLYRYAREAIKESLKGKGKELRTSTVTITGDNGVSLKLFYEVNYDLYKETYYDKNNNIIDRNRAELIIEGKNDK